MSSSPDHQAGTRTERRLAEGRRESDPALTAALREQHARCVATVNGAVRALTQLLAVVDPIAYTQALRVQGTALALLRVLDPEAPTFALESAALLRPLGTLSLGPDLRQRAAEPEMLARDEADVLASLPQLTDRLLAPIPGIEPIRALMLLWHQLPLPLGWADDFGPGPLARMRREAAMLRVSATFDALLARGMTRAEALGLMRNEADAGDSELVGALDNLHADAGPHVELRSLPLSRLRAGMVIAEAVYTHSGQLLVNRGFEVNEAFLERIANFRRGFVREPVQVRLPTPRPGDTPG